MADASGTGSEGAEPGVVAPPNGAGRQNGKVIFPRPKVTLGTAVIIALGFAVLATPILMADQWLPEPVEIGSPAPVTVRVAQFSGYAAPEGVELSGGPIIVARGQTVDPETAAVIDAVRAGQPSGAGAWAAYFTGMFLLAFIFCNHLRRSHRGRHVRAQTVSLALLLALALGMKLTLMFTTVSVLVAPVALLAIIAALVIDLSAALAIGIVASVVIGLLVPFDLGVIGILAVQALAAVIVLGEDARRSLHVVGSALLGGVAAATAYVVFYYLSGSTAALDELGDPLNSALVAAAGGGVIAALAAVPFQPIYQYMLGDITRNKLVELEDLSNPLLRQIAERSPGTWQHSLAMANMAEIAAQSIGASGRLIRVGAYYHDLGKSLQPKYFIENLEAGEQSPHDRLPPEVSCDAIFAHVTEGVAQGRKSGLPERIIDFMHMHHGDGRLEYFWTKCQEEGNPKGLTEEDFRYPGLKPQSRETAILAIVDAVEAASRTLKKPDHQAIASLVQRIVYGKLHLGQLDESGLSVADLRKISNTLIQTIKHAHHGRIEYPWQREERAAREAAKAEQLTPSQRPQPEPDTGKSVSRTERIMEQPRLDSLDVPRPMWRERRPSPIEVAATERVASDRHPAAPGAHAETTPHPRPASAPAEPAGAAPAPPSMSSSPPADETETVLLTRRKDEPAVEPTPAAVEPTPAAVEPTPAAVEPAIEANPSRVMTLGSSPGRPATVREEPRGPDPARATLHGVAVPPGAVIPEPEGEATPAARPEPTIAAEPEPVAAPHPEIEPEPAIAAEPETEPAAAPHPEIEPQPAIAAEPETAAAPPSPAPQPQPEIEPQPVIAADAAPEPETASETPSEPEPEPEPAPAAMPEPIASSFTPPPPRQRKAPAQVLADLVASADADRPDEVTRARALAPARPPRLPTEDKISEWEEALETATGGPTLPPREGRRRRRPPPPPGSPERGKRGTIELMKDPDGPAARRADSEDGLEPGMMILGPPPATLGERRRATTVTRSTEQPDDEGPTVTPASPAASMLPPRSRRKGRD